MSNVIKELKDFVGGLMYGSSYNTKTGQETINWPTPKAQYSPAPPQQQYSPSPTATPQQQYAQVQATPQQQYSPQQVSMVPQTTSAPTVTARNPAVVRYTIPDVVHKAIQTAAQTFSLPPSLLYDIALQESSFDPTLVNTTASGKKAGNPTGLFQFTDNTWKDVLNRFNNKPGMSLHLPTTDRTDPTTNAMAAAYLIKMGQLGKWNASQGVWGPQYSKDEISPYYVQTLPDRVPQNNWKQ